MSAQLAIIWLGSLIAGAVMAWCGAPLTAGLCMVVCGLCSVMGWTRC